MVKRWFYSFICLAILCSNSGFFVKKAYSIAESTQVNGSDAVEVRLVGETADSVNVGLLALGNVRTTHTAFADSQGNSHAFNHDFIGGGFEITNHETWVAGILASRGTEQYPDRVGVAPGVNIHCAKIQKNDSISFTNFNNGLTGLCSDLNCKIILVSFTLSGESTGDSCWALLCDYFAYENNVLFALPAGNNSTEISVMGDFYNGITTAGLKLTDSTDQTDYRTIGIDSGQGPTEDGRRKPEICMPSQAQTIPTATSDTAWITWSSSKGETSFSVPHTAGEAALLYSEALKTSNPDDNNMEVIKAIIINTTFPNVNDKNDYNTSPALMQNTWHYQRGYGRGDSYRAYQLICSDEIFANITAYADKGWAYDTLSPYQEKSYYIYVPKNCRLISTLTWKRRVKWTDYNQSGLIGSNELTGYLANLDMLVYEPTNIFPIFSQANNGLNPDDNLEKCDILTTKAGIHKIVIRNNSTNGETASYGMAFEIINPIEGDIAPVDYVINEKDLEKIATNWLSPDQNSDIYPDGIVDFFDFSDLLNSWLTSDPRYYP